MLGLVLKPSLDPVSRQFRTQILGFSARGTPSDIRRRPRTDRTAKTSSRVYIARCIPLEPLQIAPTDGFEAVHAGWRVFRNARVRQIMPAHVPRHRLLSGRCLSVQVSTATHISRLLIAFPYSRDAAIYQANHRVRLGGRSVVVCVAHGFAGGHPRLAAWTLAQQSYRLTGSESYLTVPSRRPPSECFCPLDCPPSADVRWRPASTPAQPCHQFDRLP